jgi:monoamine oxidase
MRSDETAVGPAARRLPVATVMHDAIIIGAGAAGLAAAVALREAGRDIIVLEARERAGGRCWSVRHDAAPLPLELGAEFVHGDATETQRLARRAGIPICDVEGAQRRARAGRFTKQDDFFERVGRVMSRLPGAGEDDTSFGTFLGARPGGRAAAYDRTLARAFVQGFHAADLDRISARALARAGNPATDETAARHARTIGGYDTVLAPMLQQVSDVVRFGHRVRRITWRRGYVQIDSDRGLVEARAVICTLPLGVLQAGDVVIDPLPDSMQRAMAGLAMGSVARVTMLFEPRFLESGVLPRRVSFLHTPHAPFSIWWTLHPLRVPVVVGWSGGPPASALLRAGNVEDRAVGELAAQLGVTRRRLEAMLVATFHHDWDADPFSRGAYSYAVVGNATASQRLARPIEGTVFMAGEATAAEDSATVEGALKSGQRAAKALLGGE